MIEAEIKAKAVKEVIARGGYATRIEDRYRVGFPDTIIILNGRPVVFAEFKVFDHRGFGVTPRQFVEMDRIDRANGHAVPVVVGWSKGLYHVHELAAVCRAENSVVEKSFHDALVGFLDRGSGGGEG